MTTSLLEPQRASEGEEPTPAAQAAEPAEVRETVAAVVAAPPEAVGAAIDRMDPAASVAGVLHALGLRDRVAFGPVPLPAASGNERAYGLLFGVEGPAEAVGLDDLEAFDEPGYVKVRLTLRVRPSAAGASLLSATARFAPTDQVTHARLLASLGLVSPAAGSLLQRTVASVRARAEVGDEA